MEDDVALVDDMYILDSNFDLMRQRNKYNVPDPFNDYSDSTFKSVYRMTKASAKELIWLGCIYLQSI